MKSHLTSSYKYIKLVVKIALQRKTKTRNGKENGKMKKKLSIKKQWKDNKKEDVEMNYW